MSQTDSSRRPRRDVDRPPTAEQSTALHQVQVQAARLRLVTDRKLGKTSPAWVRQLATEDEHDPAQQPPHGPRLQY